MTARLTLLALAALCAFAGPATFDVASVKISNAPDAAMLFTPGMVDAASGHMRVPGIGGNVTMTNWSLTTLMNAAWDLEPGQLSGPPAWLSSERYDVIAKTSPNATQADLRIMLQALLAERFKLVTHRETKETSIYALVALKGASKLMPATGNQRLPVVFAPPARLMGYGSTLATLAFALTRPAGRKVVDQTGITGGFDFTLTWSADDGADGAHSIFTALQDQLGLKLEPQKGQTEILVVDHAERVPTAN
jgi:uncharacterized protein (TIGR03435 family)